MAVKINELVIRLVVAEPDKAGAQSDSTTEKDFLVQEYVDQVMKVLKKKNSR